MIDFNDAGSQEDFYFIDEPVSSQSYHSFTFDRGALAGAIFEDIPSANITPEMVIPDGNFHRFSTDGTGKDRDGYIKTFADGLGAIYGCNRTGIKGVYQAWKPTTPQEKAEWDEKVKRGQEEAAQKLEQERAECRRKSL